MGQFHLQFNHHVLDDFILQGKDILCPPVKAIRPEIATIKGIDQLDRDPKFIFFFLNTTFHYVLDALFFSHLFKVNRLSFVAGS